MIINGVPQNQHNIRGGLAAWRAKLTNLRANKNTTLNINVWGDSISVGAHAGSNETDYRTNGHIGLIRTEFASEFESVGNGVYPSTYGFGWTGTWVENTTGMGINNYSKTSSTNGSKCTMAINGTGCRFVYLKGDGMGTFTIKSDSDPTQTVNCQSSVTELGYIDITGLTDGAHTITVTKSNDGLPITVIGAYEFKGTYGVRVNNMARSGQMISTLDTDSISVMSSTIWPCDLTLINLLTNDIESVSVADYLEDMEALIIAAKTRGDVLIITPMIKAGYTPATGLYVSGLYDLATEHNCGLIDMFRHGGGSSTDLIARGWLYDQVHPLEAGHVIYKNIIYPAIAEYVEYPTIMIR